MFADFGEVELFEELFGFEFLVGPAHGACFEDGPEVLFDGEALENARLLGEVAHAESGAFVHGEARDIVAFEDDLAFGGADHADGHAKTCSFARAVAAEESDDFALGDVEGDAVNDGAVAELFD